MITTMHSKKNMFNINFKLQAKTSRPAAGCCFRALHCSLVSSGCLAVVFATNVQHVARTPLTCGLKPNRIDPPPDTERPSRCCVNIQSTKAFRNTIQPCESVPGQSYMCCNVIRRPSAVFFSPSAPTHITIVVRTQDIQNMCVLPEIQTL